MRCEGICTRCGSKALVSVFSRLSTWQVREITKYIEHARGLWKRDGRWIDIAGLEDLEY